MSDWPVIFAAIAAVSSAIAAISAYRLQKKLAFQSFAPLISLSGWQVGGLGLIEVKKIKNYGQGPALGMHAFERSQRYPLYNPHPERNTVQAVLPQEERDISWQLFLGNASALSHPEVEKIKHMNFQIVLSYSDINNRRYYTIYDLSYLIRERGDMLIVASGEKLTPELILKKQKTIVRSDWFVRLMGNLHLAIEKVKSKASDSLTFFCSEDKNKKAE
jgi:hypothetical protein